MQLALLAPDFRADETSTFGRERPLKIPDKAGGAGSCPWSPDPGVVSKPCKGYVWLVSGAGTQDGLDKSRQDASCGRVRQSRSLKVDP